MIINLKFLAYTVTGMFLLNGCNLTDKLNEANKVISNFSTQLNKLTIVKPVVADDDMTVIIRPAELKYATTSINELRRKYLNTNGTWNFKALCEHQKLELAFVEATTEERLNNPNTNYDSSYRKFPEFVKDGELNIIDYKLSSNGYKGKLTLWVDLINPQKADVYFSKADFNKRNDFHFKLYPKYHAKLDPKLFPQITKSGYYNLGVDNILDVVFAINGICNYTVIPRPKYVVKEYTFGG